MGNRRDARTLALVGGAGLTGMIGTVLVLATLRGPAAGPGMSAEPPQDAVPEAAPLHLHLPSVGAESLEAPAPFVVYLDGVRVDGNREVLSLVRPDRIDRVEVIKGPAAKRAYGNEAEGAVVQIFTKPGDESDTQGSGSGR